MADIIRRVVTQMGLESSDYQRAADGVVQANEKMAASGQKVVDTTAQVEQRQVTSSRTIDKLEASVDKAVQAEQRYQRQLAIVQRALDDGNISQERAATVNAKVKANYDKTIASIQGATTASTQHTGAVKLQSYQIANLGQQLQDVAVQLGGGQNPFLIMLQQGPQVTTAMGGTKNALALVWEQVTLVRVGAVGLAAALAIVVARAIDISNETRTMSVALRAYGKDVQITTGQIHDLIEGMRDLGVAKDEARSAASAAISVVGASLASISQALKDAPDFSASFGVSVQDAAKKLTEMGTTGYAAIKKLDEAYNFLSVDQLRLIRELSEHGDKVGAVAVAYQALEMRINGASVNAMSPMTQATTELTRAWQDFVDKVANSAPVTEALQNAAGGLKSLTGVISGDLPTAWDGFLAYVEHHPIKVIVENSWRSWLKIGEWTSGTGSPDSAGNSPATNGTGAIGSRSFYSAANDTASLAVAKQLDEQSDAYRRQTQAMKAAAGTREAVQAGLEAEHQAMLMGADATQQATAYSQAYNVVMQRQAVAANDNVRAIDLQTKGTLRVAAAYGQGADAVMRAEAAMQADIAASQNAAVNKEKLTDAILKQKAATLELQAAQELVNARMKTAADLDALRISQIIDPQVRHDEELKAQRQQHLNELTAKYGDNIAKVNDLMAEFDKQQAIEDQTRYWNEVNALAKNYSDDITNYIVDGLTGVGNSGKSMWADMWDAALAGAKRLLVKLAATFLENTLILPIVTQVVGSNSSLLGIVGTSGGATSSLGSLGSLLSGGSGSLSSIYNMLNTGGSSLLGGLGSDLIYSSLGQSLGLSTSVVNMSHVATAGGFQATGAGSMLASGLGMLGSGLSGFGIGSLIGSLGIGNSTGSSIGGAIGGAIGSIIPGIGTIIGSVAGSLIGGLFGNSEPSDFFANTGIDLTKGTIGSVEHGRADETSSTNNSASQNLASSFLAIEKQLIALTGGTAPTSAFAKVGSRDGIVVGVGDGATFWNNLGTRKTFANTEEGAQQAIDWMVQQLAKQITGVENADIQTVLNKGGTADEILANLALVKSILESTATAADPLVTALQAINDNFDALKKQATDLGLSTDLLSKIEAARQKQIEEASAAYQLGGYQNVSSALSTITGFVTSQRLSDTSSLSPLGRQALAQQQFNDLLAKVQGGDLTQTNALTGAASNYLTIARQNYGSTSGFSSVESYITQSLAALGESIASQDSIAEQVTKAIQLSSQSNVEKLDELKASISSDLNQLRQALQLLTQQIAA